MAVHLPDGVSVEAHTVKEVLDTISNALSNPGLDVVIPTTNADDLQVVEGTPFTVKELFSDQISAEGGVLA